MPKSDSDSENVLGNRSAGREEPRPLALEELPVDEARELHQLMAQVDQVDESRTEKVVLLRRACPVLYQEPGPARF